jgi:hypothetical protein
MVSQVYAKLSSSDRGMEPRPFTPTQVDRCLLKPLNTKLSVQLAIPIRPGTHMSYEIIKGACTSILQNQIFLLLVTGDKA